MGNPYITSHLTTHTRLHLQFCPRYVYIYTYYTHCNLYPHNIVYNILCIRIIIHVTQCSLRFWRNTSYVMSPPPPPLTSPSTFRVLFKSACFVDTCAPRLHYIVRGIYIRDTASRRRISSDDGESFMSQLFLMNLDWINYTSVCKRLF